MLCCSRCGKLLVIDEKKEAAVCPLCSFSRSFRELADRETTFTSSPEAMLQSFGVEQMLPDGGRVSSLQTAVRERATARKGDGARATCFAASHSLSAVAGR